MTNSLTKRIDAADVLRGFAIAGILFLHCIEHFNFYRFPEITNAYLNFFDTIIWDGLFFMFGGKAYGIFALLFGFSFFIQDNNQLQKGNDFRLRFVWRLVLLFIWGNINAALFAGEVLVLFAITGLALPIVARMKDKTVFWIAVILLLQPVEWVKLIMAIANPVQVASASLNGPYWQATMDVLEKGNFLQSVWANLTNGQLFSILWAAENGRVLQTPAIFMFGMLIGRRGLLLGEEKNLKFWTKTAFIAILCFFPLKGLMEIFPDFISTRGISVPLNLILKSLSSFSFMVFIVSGVILLYYKTSLKGFLVKVFTPFGRMSLTMYIMQSIIGSFGFYHWGLNMGVKISTTPSIGIAIIMFVIQYTFAVWWLRKHNQGPLEYVWKKATWIGAKKK